MYPFLGVILLRDPPLKMLFSRTVAYVNRLWKWVIIRSQPSLKIAATQMNSYLFKIKLDEDKIYIKIVELDEI